MKPAIYIIKSLKNGRYYVGSTIDRERRLVEHNIGQVKATKNLRPLKMVFYQEFDNIKTARQIEYRLKKKKSRVILERIIVDVKIKFIED